MVSIDVSKLSNEYRLLLLRYVVKRYGRNRVLSILNISRSTLYRIEKGLVGLDDAKTRRLLGIVRPEELRDALGFKRLLEALGIVKPNGAINYSLIMEILKLASGDEYLKQLMIKLVLDNFREDVKKAIGLFPYNIVMHWDEGFEEFLTEHKKRRTVKDPETLKYYRNLFMKYLEGKELTPKLIDYVVNHRNKWLRNVFRHYISVPIL